MYSLNIKFNKKIITSKKVIKLWNLCNFGIPEIIPKSLVTLKFSKISLHELKGSCKCFQMRYWPHFYVDPTHSNTYFLKVGKWPVFMQATVSVVNFFPQIFFFNINHPLDSKLSGDSKLLYWGSRHNFSVTDNFILSPY